MNCSNRLAFAVIIPQHLNHAEGKKYLHAKRIVLLVEQTRAMGISDNAVRSRINMYARKENGQHRKITCMAAIKDLLSRQRLVVKNLEALSRQREEAGGLREPGYVEESEEEGEEDDENADEEVVVAEGVWRNGVLTTIVEEAWQWNNTRWLLSAYNN